MDDEEKIASELDENGDEVPQDHPIENPGDAGEEADDHDAIAEPHPDEPGAPIEQEPAEEEV